MNLLSRFCFAAALLFSTPFTAQAVPVSFLGDLSDGAVHTSSTTGYWSLSLNAGDSVTITALRLSAFDPWFVVYDPSDLLFVIGDDELPANLGLGGGFGDPRVIFAAPATGSYYVGIFRCCGEGPVEALSYSVQAVDSTVATTPIPAALPLFATGLGALGLVAYRRRRKATAA